VSSLQNKDMKAKTILRSLVMGILTLLFGSCSTIPEGLVAIKPFNKDKYLGKWYEIARLDFKFERNMNNTTAQYSINDDGTIKVVNRGYNYEKKEWKEANGIAKFVGESDIAMLKVSFFRPFYAGYNVIAIDNEYKYALVCGNKLSYLWILSRETTIPEDIKQNYLSIAKKQGFDTSALIWVEHDKK
jgi:apolipoprotein D and lipocalin family protein